MEKQLKVSVAVPVYNVAQYLDRCLESLLSQDFSDYEILLIDDGSRDSSGEICDRYAEENTIVHTYHKPNGGLSDARNYGLEKAKGEYVLFVDSDDYISRDALQKLYESAERTSADMVIGHAKVLKYSASMERFENIAKNSVEYGAVFTGKEYLERCLEGGAIRVEAWRSLYSRDFLKKNGLLFEVGITHEDEQFTPRALLCAKKVVTSECEFYFYDNSRVGSIMNSDSLKGKKAHDKLHIFEELLEIYESVTPKKLKCLLYDDISWKYIDCYCTYREQLKGEKILRAKLMKLAYKPKRRIKAIVFALSPGLYYSLHRKNLL